MAAVIIIIIYFIYFFHAEQALVLELNQARQTVPCQTPHRHICKGRVCSRLCIMPCKMLALLRK